MYHGKTENCSSATNNVQQYAGFHHHPNMQKENVQSMNSTTGPLSSTKGTPCEPWDPSNGDGEKNPMTDPVVW